MKMLVLRNELCYTQHSSFDDVTSSFAEGNRERMSMTKSDRYSHTLISSQQVNQPDWRFGLLGVPFSS